MRVNEIEALQGVRHKNFGMMGRSLSASSKELAEFGFEPPALESGTGSVRGGEDSSVDLDDILTAIRETAYRWDFGSDQIAWAPNAECVLGIGDLDKIGKGRAFALLVDPKHAGPRYDGITGGPGRTAAAIIAGLVGAGLGWAAENSADSREGIEYILRTEAGRDVTVVQNREGEEPPLGPGTPVLLQQGTGYVRVVPLPPGV